MKIKNFSSLPPLLRRVAGAVIPSPVLTTLSFHGQLIDTGATTSCICGAFDSRYRDIFGPLRRAAVKFTGAGASPMHLLEEEISLCTKTYHFFPVLDAHRHGYDGYLGLGLLAQ